MKSIQNIFLGVIIMLISFACEKNDPLSELGDLNGAVVANVYLEPLAPKFKLGLLASWKFNTWSPDDIFTYTGLWDSVAVSRIHKVTIDDVEFSASSSETKRIGSEFKAYPFDFANWNPENKAYTRKVSYTINLAYDKVTQDNDDITSDQFLADIPEDFSENMYASFASDLSRATLNSLLVDNGAMSQDEFNDHYGANGNLTTAGRTAVIAGMSQLGNKAVIGDGYQLESEYRVFLGFRAINGSGIFNDARRSFLVL